MTESAPGPSSAPATQTSSGLPGALDYSRFSALGKKSPFTLSSSPEEGADFAKELYLAGFVRLDGQDFVMVASKTKPDRILVGKKLSPSSQGMLLMEIKKDPAGDPTKMEAKIKKGTETAILKYDATGGGGAPPPVPAVAAAQPSVPVPLPQIPGLPGQLQPGQAQPAQPKISPGNVRQRRNIPTPANLNR
jgi:hypothetical protein